MKLKVGDHYKEEFIITQEMVNKFAELTGDKNPIHLNKEFAAKTIFKRPVVHGLFSVTSFGKVMGTKFPGSGSIHVGQNLSFKKRLIYTPLSPKYIKSLCIFRNPEPPKPPNPKNT